MYGLLFKTESTVSYIFWLQIITVGNFKIGIYVTHLLSIFLFPRNFMQTKFKYMLHSITPTSFCEQCVD